MSIKTLIVSALVATVSGKAAAKVAKVVTPKATHPATETIYSIAEDHCFELEGPYDTVQARLAVVQKTAAEHDLTVQVGECKDHKMGTQVGTTTTFEGMKASQWKKTVPVVKKDGEEQSDLTNFLIDDETDLADYKDKVCHTVPGHNEVCVSKKAALKDKNIVYTISENKEVCIQFNGKMIENQDMRKALNASLKKRGYTMLAGRCFSHGFEF